jgi:hypothetical protein
MCYLAICLYKHFSICTFIKYLEMCTCVEIRDPQLAKSVVSTYLQCSLH